MKQIKIDFNDRSQLEKAAKAASNVLKRGGVVVYPTDTLYGLGANGYNEDAVLKVYKIKSRNRNKPLPVLIRDMNMARKIACIDSIAESVLNRLWPGPITVVLRKKDAISYMLTGNEETVAARIPLSEFVSKLMKYIDFPITATSANISGEKDLITPDKIIETFKNSQNAPDLFIDAGEIINPNPSTIIDLTGRSPKIIRIGVVKKEKMSEFFSKFTQ